MKNYIKWVLCFVLIQSLLHHQAQSQQLEWNMDGSLYVTNGTELITVTSAIPTTEDEEGIRNMPKLNLGEIMGLHPDLNGGISSTQFSSGKITLTVYLYDKSANHPTISGKKGGKGMPLYRIHSSGGGELVEEVDDFPSIDYSDDLAFSFSSNDIKGRIISSVPEVLEILYGRHDYCHTGLEATSIFSFFESTCGSLIDYSVVLGKMPVIVELTREGSSDGVLIDSIKIPGMSVSKVADLRDEDLIKISINGTPKLDNLTGASSNSVSAKVGDQVTFNVRPREGREPHIQGLPATWIARFAGETKFICTPSITPGGYKPWIGFDSQVHGSVIRAYPQGYDPKEADWEHLDDDWYQLTYTLQRRMSSDIDEHSPLVEWEKTQGDPLQRRNQREGLNMELLDQWDDPQYGLYSGANFLSATDPDEIIYLQGGEKLFKTDNEPWKALDQSEPSLALNRMVLAYQKNRTSQDPDGNPSSIDTYDGYEIEDIGTTKQNIEYPRGTGQGNLAAPGKVVVGGTEINFDVGAPLDIDFGFYAMVDGDQWPAVNSTATYTIRGFDADVLYANQRAYKIELQFEDYLGVIHKQTKYPIDGTYIPDSGFAFAFDIGSLGYYNIAVYYSRSVVGDWVLIGGKEIFPISLRFLSVPGSKHNAFTSNQQDGLDLKEGKGDPGYSYREDFRSPDYGQKAEAAILDGDFGDKWSRTYTFKKGETTTFAILDADPHTFTIHETDWYQSERKLAKRIPDDELSDRLTFEVREFYNPMGTIYDNYGESLASGTGKTFKHTWDKIGTFQLSAFYQESTSAVSHVINVSDYLNFTENISLKQRARIAVRDLTTREREWLGITDLKYKVARIRNIDSKYLYVDGKRGQNRFGPYNDFKQEFVWSKVGSADIGQPEFVTNWLDNYTKDWFPSNWVRHFSGPLPSDLSQEVASTELADQHFAALFQNAPPEPWQVRLPWVSITDAEGGRMRTNVKCIYDMNAFFDNDHGAFSGNPTITGDTWAAYGNDDDLDKEKFYQDLMHKEVLIFDAATVNKLLVSNKNADDTNDDLAEISLTDIGLYPSSLIKGVDLSSANQYMDEGVNLYDHNGDEQSNYYKLFKDLGANLVRLKLWAQPKSCLTGIGCDDWNYSNIYDVRLAMQRAKSNNLPVLLDFQLSDTWADPEKQTRPAAWEGLSHSSLMNSLHSYIYNTLHNLKFSDGVIPTYVQIGNEINKPILQTAAQDLVFGESSGESALWERQAELLNAGLSAVDQFNQEETENIKKILHLTDPVKATWFLDRFQAHGISNYDVLGLSYYPLFHNTSLDELSEIISTIKTGYQKDVMIVETGFAFTHQNIDSRPNFSIDPSNPGAGSALGTGIGFFPTITSSQFQRQWMLDLKGVVQESGALGLIYWEPTWLGAPTINGVVQNNVVGKDFDIPGSPWDNMVFFDSQNILVADGGVRFLCDDLVCSNWPTSSSGAAIMYGKSRAIEEEKPLRTEISIFPNPSKDIFNIEITLETEKKVEIELVDLQGRIVVPRQQAMVGEGSHMFYLNNLKQLGLPGGIYLLNIILDGKKEVRKVMLK